MTARKRTKPNSGSSKTGAPGILERLNATEAASILSILLKRHPDLHSEAEALATEALSDISLLSIADDVEDAVLQFDFDDLNSRSGRRPWGYVEPYEGAYELLEEGLEPFLNEMKRYLDLAFEEQARTFCQGILLGLYRVRALRGNPALDFAEDFPLDAAGNLLDVWRKTSQLGRQGIPAAPHDFVAEHIPEWAWVIERRSRPRGASTNTTNSAPSPALRQD